MRVGLDAYTLRESNLTIWQLIDRVVAHRLEGLQFDHHLLKHESPQRLQDLVARAAVLGLYLELAGPSINPGRTDGTVTEAADAWRPLFPLAEGIGSSIINTSFGLLKERLITSPSLTEQIEMTAQVLRALAPMAEAHNVTVAVELHVDLTSLELLRLIETVNSPHVAVNLDTANACGLMEDPVDAATRLAPYVRTAHLKDTCVYPVDGGYNWQGGSVLGRGLVDLPTIVDILYRANPAINLNIEDSGGCLLIPSQDEAFLASLTDLTPMQVVRFHQLLQRGQELVRSGVQPNAEENQRMNWKDAIAARLEFNADYARRLRDDVVAGYSADESR